MDAEILALDYTLLPCVGSNGLYRQVPYPKQKHEVRPQNKSLSPAFKLVFFLWIPEKIQNIAIPINSEFRYA